MRAYDGRHWHAIDEHLHDTLGRQAAGAGNNLEAAQHFMALLQVRGVRVHVCLCVCVCAFVRLAMLGGGTVRVQLCCHLMTQLK